MPLYQQELVGGQWCARSLRDGTLLLPKLGIDDGLEKHCITVWWQGDCHRASAVDGTHLASLALVDYVQFHSAGKAPKHLADLLECLSHHFTFKTGGHLYLPYAEDELRALGEVLGAVKRYGPDLAWEVLKKNIGL